MSNELVLIGCGNMGHAMLRGFLRENPGLVAHVVEPVDALRKRATLLGAYAVAAVAELPADLQPALSRKRPRQPASEASHLARLLEN